MTARVPRWERRALRYSDLKILRCPTCGVTKGYTDANARCIGCGFEFGPRRKAARRRK